MKMGFVSCSFQQNLIFSDINGVSIFYQHTYSKFNGQIDRMRKTYVIIHILIEIIIWLHGNIFASIIVHQYMALIETPLCNIHDELYHEEFYT